MNKHKYNNTVSLREIEQFLANMNALAGLSSQHFCLLARLVHVRKMEPEEMLWRQGQKITHFNIIFEGCLRSVRLSVSGQEKLLSTLPPGYHFGLAEMITGADSSTTIIASEQATVLMLDRKTLQEQLLSHVEICYRLMQIMARAIFSLTRQLEQAAFENVHTRLARLLLHKITGPKENMSESNFLENISHADLALQLGVSRETVTRVLADFKQHCLIETGYRTLRIRDIAGLMTYVEDLKPC